MPKSKRGIKRRKKVKRKYNTNLTKQSDYDGSFDKPYMKTDGNSRVCKYDKNHKFLGYATPDESSNF